jgi:hypothetical protein
MSGWRAIEKERKGKADYATAITFSLRNSASLTAVSTGSCGHETLNPIVSEESRNKIVTLFSYIVANIT